MSEHERFDPFGYLLNVLRFWVAKFAMRFCGTATLYWTAPAEWEEYMGIGEPYWEARTGD